MIPPSEQLLNEASVLSDAELERIDNLPPMTDEQAALVRGLLFPRRTLRERSDARPA